MKIILPLILALAALPAYAQLYKWTDADGKVHYSDRPQDGARSKEIAVQRAATKPAAAPANDWQQRELESRERRLQRETANHKRPIPQRAIPGRRRTIPASIATTRL